MHQDNKKSIEQSRQNMSISYFFEILPCLVLSSHMKTLFVFVNSDSLQRYRPFVNHFDSLFSYKTKKKRIFCFNESNVSALTLRTPIFLNVMLLLQDLHIHLHHQSHRLHHLHR